ncbi:MAG: methyl-accepting chemotaxis protein [Nitrospirota bacterium]
MSLRTWFADKSSKGDGKALAEAISQMQAVIDMNLDGTIITANAHFLNCFGYGLDEVKGKHHRMFVDSDYAASAEYQSFWEKLNRGEVDSGVYGRIGKGGKEIWVQASYTPVFGAAGRPAKVIAFGTDVTAQWLELENLRDELKVRVDIMNTTSIVSEADLKGDIVAVNDKFLQVSKYPKNELIGHGHNTTRHPDMPKEVFKQMWATIGRGQIFRGVVKNRAKDGTPYYVDAVIAPFVDKKTGKPRKYLGVRYDITEQEIARHNMKGIINAIDKSYASIEFKLDGTIATANENFLKILGYTLDEIKGQHHRMLCDPAYAASPEYQAFWAKLKRGEFDAGVYRQLGKGGKEIWIQASYNPIMDEMGRPFKVVKFATDITGQKKAQNEVEKLSKAAAAGELSERIKTEEFAGASKELTESFNRLLDSVAAPLHEAQTVLTALASNDLTKQMTGSYQGEFEQMKTCLNTALQNLTGTVSTVRDTVEAVTAGSEQITKGSEDLSQRTSEQASALEETSASMEEMTSIVKQSADNAKQANQLAIAARDTADKGGSVTKKAVDAMGEINKSSKKIADITTVIDGIAFQTNLLALNAAVEAARAGEHGRGFAVVAAEVRDLAQRSATAAKEIKALINESIQRVNDGSELVNQSGKTLEEIVNSVKRVTDIIAEITAASQEQASEIDQVNKAIVSMDETTQQNTALVEETTTACQSMMEQAQELMRQVEVFKVNGTGEASHVKRFGREASLVKREAPGTGKDVKRPDPKTRYASRDTLHAAEPSGVVAGNGKDRHSTGDEFEEF